MGCGRCPTLFSCWMQHQQVPPSHRQLVVSRLVSVLAACRVCLWCCKSGCVASDAEGLCLLALVLGPIVTSEPGKLHYKKRRHTLPMSSEVAVGAGAHPALPAGCQMPTLCLSCATAAAMAAGLAVASGGACTPSCSLNCFNTSATCSRVHGACLLLTLMPSTACRAASSASSAPQAVAAAPLPPMLPGRLPPPAAAAAGC